MFRRLRAVQPWCAKNVLCENRLDCTFPWKHCWWNVLEMTKITSSFCGKIAVAEKIMLRFSLSDQTRNRSRFRIPRADFVWRMRRVSLQYVLPVHNIIPQLKRYSLLRRNKVESEIRVKQSALTLAEMTQYLQLRQEEDESIFRDIEDIARHQTK